MLCILILTYALKPYLYSVLPPRWSGHNSIVSLNLDQHAWLILELIICFWCDIGGGFMTYIYCTVHNSFHVLEKTNQCLA
uniref:Uncharacterized protein n=1 Tax=Arundo donax TaxID=35708 RepID=A0A0A9B6J4_ARUDO